MKLVLAITSLIIGAQCQPVKIVNGLAAKPGQFPFQVLLRSHFTFGTSVCGGALISGQWVLTAAHCAQGADDIETTFGTLRLNGDGGLKSVSSSFFVHEDYNSYNLQNDLALIKLEASINFTDSIQPVKLPAADQLADLSEGLNVTAIGWGKEKDIGIVSSRLRFATLKVIDNVSCNETYLVVQPTTICAVGGHAESTCNGDSGGPLVLESQNILVGITSFGHIQGCELGLPVGFSRITMYMKWIENIIKNN